jgi:hypothetical protein
MAAATGSSIYLSRSEAGRDAPAHGVSARTASVASAMVAEVIRCVISSICRRGESEHRNISKGQQAMRIALLYPEPEREGAGPLFSVRSACSKRAPSSHTPVTSRLPFAMALSLRTEALRLLQQLAALFEMLGCALGQAFD